MTQVRSRTFEHTRGWGIVPAEPRSIRPEDAGDRYRFGLKP